MSIRFSVLEQPKIRAVSTTTNVVVAQQVVGLQGPVGPQGPQGPKGDDVPDDLIDPPDLVILFENGLI